MLKFTKMVATGNDFIMIDNRKNAVRSRAEFARKYCRQHFSIGADGVILIERPLPFTLYPLPFDFRMRIFNPDGSEAEMCGNGARCVAVFAYLKRVVKKPKMRFQTLAGIISAVVVGNGARIGMSDDSERTEYTDSSESEPSGFELNKKLLIDGPHYAKAPYGRKNLTVHHINTGVPHTILISKDIEHIDIMKVAPPIRYNRIFPKGTNVDFVQIVNNHRYAPDIGAYHRIKMRTYERGVEGETLACGTGAVAAAIISSLLGFTKPPIEVVVKGGLLKVYFNVGPRCDIGACSRRLKPAIVIKDVFLEGGAKIVYEGEINDSKK